AIEAIEDLVARGRSMRDAERIVRDGGARGERRAVAGVERVQLAPPSDTAQPSRDEGERDAASTPGQVVREATAHTYPPVGRVERGEAATAQRFPVVVVDRVRHAVGAGHPHERAVPEDDPRLEVDVDGPPRGTEA